MARKIEKKPGIRQKRRAFKRARILAAARSLLRRHGHERLSLRDVARRARLSPAGMYEFFDAREDLVAALALEANARLSGEMRSAARGAADPVARLVRLGLAYIRFAQEHPTDFMLVFGRLSMRRSLAEEASPDSEYGQIRSAVAEVVGAWRPGGAERPFLEALAYGYWSTIHGMAMLRLTHLAGFSADFEGAHRLVLESIAASWRRIDWRKALGSRARPSRPTRPGGARSSGR